MFKFLLLATVCVLPASAVLDRHKCSTATWFRAARAACILGGTDLELLNTAGCTAAHAAATNMHLDLLKLLNEKGANMNHKCKNTGKTPLMHAAKHGDDEAVRYLLAEAGADPYIEVTDTEGTWTALSFAAWEGHIEIVLFFHRLEQHGLPSKKQDFSGSWLMWAAGSGETDVTKLLSDGHEPGGTEINAVDEHGFTAAFWAGQNGHLQTLQTLIAEGADLTITSKAGLTMLMAAAYWGKSEVVEFLLDSGLHPDQHDRAGWNACMWAAAHGELVAMDLLFSTGDSCITTNGGGWTALHIAAATGQTKAALWLVKRGALVDKKTLTGKSAFDMAHHRHNPGTHDALQEHHKGDDWMDQLEKEHDPLVTTGKDYMPKKMHPDNHRPRNPAAVPQTPGGKFLPNGAGGPKPGGPNPGKMHEEF